LKNEAAFIYLIYSSPGQNERLTRFKVSPEAQISPCQVPHGRQGDWLGSTAVVNHGCISSSGVGNDPTFFLYILDFIAKLYIPECIICDLDILGDKFVP